MNDLFTNQIILNTEPRSIKKRDNVTNKKGENELRTKEKF